MGNKLNEKIGKQSKINGNQSVFKIKHQIKKSKNKSDKAVMFSTRNDAKNPYKQDVKPCKYEEIYVGEWQHLKLSVYKRKIGVGHIMSTGIIVIIQKIRANKYDRIH